MAIPSLKLAVESDIALSGAQTIQGVVLAHVRFPFVSLRRSLGYLFSTSAPLSSSWVSPVSSLRVVRPALKKGAAPAPTDRRYAHFSARLDEPPARILIPASTFPL